MTHTPGPWHWVAGDAPNMYGGLIGPTREVLLAWDEGVGVGSSDARLIAAAPDLYVALKEFIEYAQGIAPREEGDRRYDAALVALAKAEQP